VDYTDEKGCFEGICSELGNFYAELPLEGGGVEAEEIIANNELIDEEAKKFVKHTLYPALAFLLVPPKGEERVTETYLPASNFQLIQTPLHALRRICHRWDSHEDGPAEQSLQGI